MAKDEFKPKRDKEKARAARAPGEDRYIIDSDDLAQFHINEPLNIVWQALSSIKGLKTVRGTDYFVVQLEDDLLTRKMLLDASYEPKKIENHKDHPRLLGEGHIGVRVEPDILLGIAYRQTKPYPSLHEKTKQIISAIIEHYDLDLELTDLEKRRGRGGRH